MADFLPTGDMGMKSLPPPAPLSLPEGLGDREVSAPAKVKDGLEPIIMSLDLLNESVDLIVSEVSDSDTGKLTVADLDKLFQRYFSKQVIADSVSLALTRQSPPAIESSLMVRQQVKANDVIKNQPSGKFEDVFSKQSSGSSSKSSKSGEGFEAKYNKVLDTAYTATHKPLELVDKLIPALVGLFTKNKDSEKANEKKKEKGSFYGQGDVEEGAFYGSFSQQATKAVGSTVEGAADIGAKGLKGAADVGATGIVGAKALLGAALGTNLNAGLEGDLNPGVVGATSGGGGKGGGGGPLGTAADPLYIMDAGALTTSTASDIYEEAAEAGVKADTALQDTLENPEQSNFANFVGGGGEGGGGKGKKKAGESGGGAGIGVVLIAGMILVALIVFKDVIEKIFDKVIIPLGEILIDFLTALKEPLIALISAIIDVAIVVFGVIKDVLLAIQPYIADIAAALCGVVLAVLEIIRDILVAIKPYLIQMAEAISGIVVSALNLIKGILEALTPHIIRLADVFGSIGIIIAEAIRDLIKIITFPLRLISGILEVIQPHIIRIAEFIGGVIADWFEANGETLTRIFDNVGRVIENVSGIIERITSVMERVISAVTGLASRIVSGLQHVFGPVFEKIGGLFSSIGGGLQKVADGVVNVVTGTTVAERNQAKAERNQAEADRAQAEFDEEARSELNAFNSLMDQLSPEDSTNSTEILQGIYKDTTLIANLLYEEYKGHAGAISARLGAKQAGDLIISSDGQVYETAPTDSILAIQNGQVSMNQSNPVSGVSSSNIGASGGQQSSSSSSVTNVYNQPSILDSAGVSPFSDFCPVGVG